jgi:hypothetical protein
VRSTANGYIARDSLTLILPQPNRLPFAPLEAFVAEHGSVWSMGELLHKAYYRARAHGVTLDAAERFAAHFHGHPLDIWGWAYYELVLAGVR